MDTCGRPPPIAMTSSSGMRRKLQTTFLRASLSLPSNTRPPTRGQPVSIVHCRSLDLHPSLIHGRRLPLPSAAPRSKDWLNACAHWLHACLHEAQRLHDVWTLRSSMSSRGVHVEVHEHGRYHAWRTTRFCRSFQQVVDTTAKALVCFSSSTLAFFLLATPGSLSQTTL